MYALVPALFFAYAISPSSAAAASCPSTPGVNSCTLVVSSDTYTSQQQPSTSFGSAATLQSYEDPRNVKTRHLWLTFPTQQLPAGVMIQSAVLRLWPTASTYSSLLARQTYSPTQCPQTTCTWSNEGPLDTTPAGSSSGSIVANAWISVPISTPGYISVGSPTSFRVRASAYSKAVSFASREGGPTHTSQLTVTYSASAPTSNGCGSSLDAGVGLPFCLQGQNATSPANQPLPASPAVDPFSASIVAALNSGQHNADFSEFGTPVYDAASGTTPVRLNCTEADWGTCSLQGQTVDINPAWRPSWGSDHALVVVDRSARKVYDFWDVATTATGTLSPSNNALSTAWGGVTSLDGNGQSLDATGSGLSHLFGMVWTSEMANAVLSPSTAIPHALHFSSSFTCATYRYPAIKSDGSHTGSCIPEGTRVFLNSSTNCAAVTPAGSEAVCYALQRYGAYDTDTSGSTFALGFEGDGMNDVPAVYSQAGFGWDYYDMKNIPWSHLEVATNCACTPT